MGKAVLIVPTSQRGELGERFRLYVEKVLLPTLRPGDIVIMDNLGSHRGSIVRELIRSVGAKLLFLPKYSPDLTPSNRSLPSSSTSSEEPPPARSKPFAAQSARFCSSSPQENAQAPWQTQDMHEPNFITL
jgi:hypothetical protein